MTCPLCDYEHSRRSWIGSVIYQGKEFPYSECLSCRSLYCDRMPDEETLAEMYGPGYEESQTGNPCLDDPKEPARVAQWLKKLHGKVFIDYGCGTGELLSEALRLNWEAIGVELDER